MGNKRAKNARLKNAVEFGRTEMGEGLELTNRFYGPCCTPLWNCQEYGRQRSVSELTLNVPNYSSDMTQRELAVELADYLATKLGGPPPRRSQCRPRPARVGQEPAAGVGHPVPAPKVPASDSPAQDPGGPRNPGGIRALKRRNAERVVPLQGT